MEGRWGRRIKGRIWSDGLFTHFYLEISTGQNIEHREACTMKTSHLRLMPNLYGLVLDGMTRKLEVKVKNAVVQ